MELYLIKGWRQSRHLLHTVYQSCPQHFKTYLRVGNLTNPVRIGVPLDDDLILVLDDLQPHQHTFNDQFLCCQLVIRRLV